MVRATRIVAVFAVATISGNKGTAADLKLAAGRHNNNTAALTTLGTTAFGAMVAAAGGARA